MSRVAVVWSAAVLEPVLPGCSGVAAGSPGPAWPGSAPAFLSSSGPRHASLPRRSGQVHVVHFSGCRNGKRIGMGVPLMRVKALVKTFVFAARRIPIVEMLAEASSVCLERSLFLPFSRPRLPGTMGGSLQQPGQKAPNPPA